VGTLPALKPRQVVALLEGLGFVEVRQRGSHKQFRHADGRGTTVPVHSSRDISPTLLRKIAKDIGLTAEQLLGRSEPAAEEEVEPDDG
jgi:predicted RNA binding protein YcfA (HicA-like mRNA interferase family)